MTFEATGVKRIIPKNLFTVPNCGRTADAKSKQMASAAFAEICRQRQPNGKTTWRLASRRGGLRPGKPP